MEETLKQDIQKAIERSGFPLENYVDVILRKHGWQTITNRHYIDDVKGVERELDILAYKVYKDDNERIEYITSLIISCKKSEVNKWCFLTRDANLNDANTDWTPFHYCTNDKILDYMTKNHRAIITDKYLNHRAIKHLYNFNERVFAYQVLSECVVSKGKGKDKKEEKHWEITKNEPLHDSIITSIKALDMEKRSRIEQHIGRPYNRYYTFHILSLYDGDMVKSHLDDKGDIESKEITHINYLNRHIVNKVDDFYIVNFIHKDILNFRLQLFDYLHDENTRTLPLLIKTFYENIFYDDKKVQMKWDVFEDYILWKVKSILTNDNVITPSDDVRLLYYYNKKEALLEIKIDTPYNTLTREFINHMNINKDLKDITYKALIKVFRYEGRFVFTDGLPF